MSIWKQEAERCCMIRKTGIVTDAKKAFRPRDTIIEYMYRDAGNYKFHGSFALSGILALKEVEPYLISGEYFLPVPLGLPCLVPEQMNDDDHMLHEFVALTYVTSAVPTMSKRKFLKSMRTAHSAGWFTDDSWPIYRRSLKRRAISLRR